MINRTEIERTVEAMLRCRAAIALSVPVKEKFRRRMAWEGIVYILDVQDRPEADCAYAWFSPPELDGTLRFFAALKIGAIKTPVDAVRAAILVEYLEARARNAPSPRSALIRHGPWLARARIVPELAPGAHP